jgi:hypothetical protein
MRSTPPSPAQLAGAHRQLRRDAPAIVPDFVNGRLPSMVERRVRAIESSHPSVAAVGPRLVLVAGGPVSGSRRLVASTPPPAFGRTWWVRRAVRAGFALLYTLARTV